MSLILASPAFGVSWDEIPIREGEGDLPTNEVGLPGGLITLGSSTAVAMYGDLTYDDDSGRLLYANVAIRRSTNSGTTWQEPLILSTDASTAMAISGRGTNVDAVWIDKISDPDAAQVMYARSSDSAASFGSPHVFASPVAGYPLDVSVARGPNATVAIAWTTKQGSWSIVRVRISTDGGVTFGPPATVATGVARDVKVAIGDGVAYAVFFARESNGSRSLYMRRSLDNGAGWTATRKLGANVYNGYSLDVRTAPTLTAEGVQAYVGFMSGVPDDRVRLFYRHTADGGQTWTALKRLTGPLSFNPRAEMTLQGGIARVAYARCGNRWCDYQTIRYKQSADGQTWSGSETVGYSDLQPWVAGVGKAGKVLVLQMQPPDGSYGPFGTYVSVRTP